MLGQETFFLNFRTGKEFSFYLLLVSEATGIWMRSSVKIHGAINSYMEIE